MVEFDSDHSGWDGAWEERKNRDRGFVFVGFYMGWSGWLPPAGFGLVGFACINIYIYIKYTNHLLLLKIGRSWGFNDLWLLMSNPISLILFSLICWCWTCCPYYTC